MSVINRGARDNSATFFAKVSKTFCFFFCPVVPGRSSYRRMKVKTAVIDDDTDFSSCRTTEYSKKENLRLVSHPHVGV